MNIGFVGLGVMGAPMAAHLAAAGHALTVYNRSPDKARRWQQQHGGRVAGSIGELARDSEVLITCVGNDDDLRGLCLGPDGAYGQLPAGALHIDHTTTSARLARELADAAAEAGLDFVDAPVSGGQAGAEQGSLSIMAGGTAEAFARAERICASYAGRQGHIGAAGSGQLAKMVNQICVAGVIQGLAEGLRFGEAAGLDMRKVLEVIAHGAAGSWQMHNRGDTMLRREFDFGFAVDWMRKDLGIVAEEAAALGLRLPVTPQIAAFYDELAAAGDGRSDTSALIKRL